MENLSMYEQSVDANAELGGRKSAFARENPLGYFIASMLAGIYVGLGIVLIFSIGAPLALAGHPASKLVMGASFGLALVLVVFAGSELFTGNAMLMTFACLRRKATLGDLARVWTFSWLGNMAGSLALAWLVVATDSVVSSGPFIEKVAAGKMSASPWVLMGRGLLCNLLVCLAIWTANRTRSDAAKILLICWCLLGFIGSGYEHSIANMTLLGLGILARTSDAVGWSGLGYNLLWVTVGNTLGAVMLVGAYHVMSPAQRSDAAATLKAKEAA
jgi:nitrite transporter NirC